MRTSLSLHPNIIKYSTTTRLLYNSLHYLHGDHRKKPTMSKIVKDARYWVSDLGSFARPVYIQAGKYHFDTNNIDRIEAGIYSMNILYRGLLKDVGIRGGHQWAFFSPSTLTPKLPPLTDASTPSMTYSVISPLPTRSTSLRKKINRLKTNLAKWIFSTTT